MGARRAHRAARLEDDELAAIRSDHVYACIRCVSSATPLGLCPAATRASGDSFGLPERHRLSTFSLQYAYSASSTGTEYFR